MLFLPFPFDISVTFGSFWRCNLLHILYTYHLNFQHRDTRIHFSQSPIQQENGTPKKQTVFFLSSSSFQDFPFVFHVFSLKKVVVFFHHQNVGPFRALRTHHGGYITPPSAHRGGPPGRDVTTERASWISTVPTTTNKPPEVFGWYWMQLEDERVLLFCCFFFLCFLCLKVRFKCVVFFNHVFVVRELVDYEKFPKDPQTIIHFKVKTLKAVLKWARAKITATKVHEKISFTVCEVKKGGIFAEEHHVVSEVVGFNILAVVDNQSPSNVHLWKAKKPWKLTWKHHHQRTHSQDSQRISDSIFCNPIESFLIFATDRVWRAIVDTPGDIPRIW